MQLLKWVLVVLLAHMTMLLLTGTDFLFIDYVNLLMHEAGHLLLYFFGTTISFLGGTFMQLLVPVMCGLVLIIQQDDWFSGGLSSWWVGENLVNVGRYMKDAPYQVLPLIGGEHDWVHLFSQWQLLPHAESIGQITLVIGFVIMTGSIIWLIKQLLSPQFKTTIYYAKKNRGYIS